MGKVILMGLPSADTQAKIGVVEITTGAKVVMGVNLGSFRPNLDFDRYFRLFLRGRLPLDRLVSARFHLRKLRAGSIRPREVTASGVMLVP